MKHATQTQFGRPVEVVQMAESPTDKWEALSALTEAAEQFELSHRTLGVLKALMTFLPGRIISPAPGGAIVFPSNRTLSHRLNGMPDSTLRRHLAQLVRIGVVSRHDSPNRKRYARHRGQGVAIAFGFDLSPLARQHQMLEHAALKARETRKTLLVAREELMHLRHLLLERTGQGTLTEEARAALRRNPDFGVLVALKERIEAKLSELVATEMSTADAQNERHIQDDPKYNPDSEVPENNAQSPKKRKPLTAPSGYSEKTSGPELQSVLLVCREFRTYYPSPVRHWHDLIAISERLTTMIGIDGPVFKQAILAMGATRAATVVLCILENIASISNPGGYLRRLTQQARAGEFSERPMLAALSRRVKLSADNYDNAFVAMG